MTDLPGVAAPGRFGPYGGRYVPETLMAALEELERVYDEAKGDPRFWAELDGLLKDYVGRPTPLTETPRLGAEVDGQTAHYRRDGRGPARRRHGHRVRPLRARVRGVYG